MAAKFVVHKALLSSVLEEIHNRLALIRDYRNYLNKDVVKKLEITLLSINEVLDDAETKDHLPSVKNWLVELQRAAYELEQLVDVISTDGLLRVGVKRYFVSGIIKRFESRFMIKGLLRRLEFLAGQKDILGLQEEATRDNHVTPSNLCNEIPTESSVDDESVIIGRDHEKEEIIHFVLANSDRDNQASIIGIVGLRGMGKTTLAQHVYNDHRIVEQFDFKVWVCVSQFFDVFCLTRSILEALSSSAGNSQDLETLLRQLQQRLMGKRCLLVLDDVSRVNEKMWKHLLFPFTSGSSQGKVIITTRDVEIGYMMEYASLLHLKQLEESDSWSLFVKHAFRGMNVVEYPNHELIGKKIVEKCGGLPLALKTLGSILQTKSSQSEWVKILNSDLSNLLKVDNIINSIPRLSYFNLPSNLKRCFAYCSIFPKDYEFEKDELIKLWVAEGLLKGSERYHSEERLGNEFFNHLVSISFFRQSVIMPLWTDKDYFTMHDAVYDLAKSVSGESCLRIEGDNVQHIPQRTRHMWCCLDLKDGDRKLEHISKIEGLHSLMVEAQGYGDQRFKISTNVQQNLFSRLKYLRMLSFSGGNLLELADEIRYLKFLRYLDLSYTEITCLPNSICMLSNLLTLLLQDCFKLTVLPSEFCKLINLRHLNLEGTHIKKMPMEIGGLNNLRKLTDFVVGEQHGSDIKHLGKLNKLQGKLRISGLENVIDPADAVAANLKIKSSLKELSMAYDEKELSMSSLTEAPISVLEALQPNTNLMRLTIKDYRDSSFPNWLGDRYLLNLVSLELLGCKLCSQLPPLGQLPSLKKLSISGCDGIEIIGAEFSGYDSTNVPFRSLEILRFDHMSEWKEWLCLESFPLLQELCIKHCPKLKSALPQQLPSLQKLEIIDCQELECSIPKAGNISELELKRCDDVLVNEFPFSLKRVALCGTRVIKSMLEKILFYCVFLEELEVEDFFGPNLEWSSMDFNSCIFLHTLTITGWHSSSLPFELDLFTNLNSLVLHDCPWLESVLGKQLPSNLCSLRIERCPKLMGSRKEWDLFQLNSLKQFSVGDHFEIFESFPEESLLPSTINSLELINCSNLRIINYKGLLHLTSLESLYIEDCPCLESLPEEGLPSSLSTLAIYDCPLIKQLYQKEGGERWNTISHIPSVTIS